MMNMAMLLFYKNIFIMMNMAMLLFYKKSEYEEKDYLINFYFSEHSKKSVEKKVPAAKAQAQKEKVSFK